MTDNIIDTGALAKLKDMIGGGAEDLAELVDDFVTSFPDQAALMHRQADGEDWGALRISAHSCKSNARDLGATALSALCAELELQCKSGAPTEPGLQISGIEAAGAAAMTALRQLDLGDV
ncbi:MAG: Hpt domain-containing protein [Pseudomonadota bacterium]